MRTIDKEQNVNYLFLEEEKLELIKMKVKKIVKPVLIYESESWIMVEKYRSRINLMEIGILRIILEKIKQDKMPDGVFSKHQGTELKRKRAGEAQLRWCGHICSIKEIYIWNKITVTKEKWLIEYNMN